MCNLSQGIEENGIAIGQERGIAIGQEKQLLQSLQNLMDTLKLTAEQAMAALKVPETEWMNYAERLKCELGQKER